MTNELSEYMERHGLVVRICNGAVTFCDGDCDNCEDEDDYDEEDEYEFD